MGETYGTPFSIVYDSFLSKITDDMYMELTELETFRMLQELLVSSIHWFEFPRVNINDYDEDEAMDIMLRNLVCHDFFTWDFEHWRPYTDDELKLIQKKKKLNV